MTTLREAAQQALEAMEREAEYFLQEHSEYNEVLLSAIEALKVALAEPVQEPVAWLRVIDEAMVTHHLGVADPTDDYETAKRKMNNLLSHAQDIGAYFAAPPQRPAEPVQEPVCDKDPRGCYSVRCQLGRMCKHATPPQRKPLTEETLSKIIDAEIGFNSCVGWEEDFARAIERAHGIT